MEEQSTSEQQDGVTVITAKKVFVSGCFDLLHAGHVFFFETASKYGDLYVSIGSDDNIRYLKHRSPVYSQEERLYLIKSLSGVKEAFIAKGIGVIDFLSELESITPDYFVVNEDGHSALKQKIVEDLGIEYVVLKRNPKNSLPARSTTALRRFIQNSYTEARQLGRGAYIPFRIDLCGGWLDQPFVSSLCGGSVITFPVFGLPHEFYSQPLDLKNIIDFSNRSGMSSSTRRCAIELWGNSIGFGDPEKLAYNLFCYNNPPGTKQISGAQDSIGIVIPGITKSYYNGEYWPLAIETTTDESSLKFVEQHICLVPLQPRVHGYNPLSDTKVSAEGAKNLAKAARDTWNALMKQDLVAFGRGVTDGFMAQVAMFPDMADEYIFEFINEVMSRNPDNIVGYKLSGAGGGGYLICVVKNILPNSLVIKIPRNIIRE